MWNMGVTIRNLYLVALVALTNGCTADAPPAPPAPPQRLIVSDVEVVGCYELVTLRWEKPPARLRDLLVYEPPQVFFLSAEQHPKGRRTITPRDPNAAHAYSAWRVVKQTTIEAIWSTGSEGVRASVHRHSTDPLLWEGLAERMSRIDPSQGRIVLRRTSPGPCPPSP